MKDFSLVVMITIFLVFLCTIEMSCGYTPEWGQHFKSRIKSIRHDRFRRQVSPNCTRVYEEITTPHFMDCEDTFDEVVDMDATDNELQVFCDNNCASEIIHALKDYATYCDKSAGVSNIIDTDYKWSCNVKHMYFILLFMCH